MSDRRFLQFIYLMVFIWFMFTALGIYAGTRERPPIRVVIESQLHEECQYPIRPLKDGRCDNSDPACPETMKIDGGNCLGK